MTESRTKHEHGLLLRGGLCLIFSFLALLSYASPALAQSTGGFAGAILELTPPKDLANGSFKSIKDIIEAAGGASKDGTFYLEGNVFLNKTVKNCAPPSQDEEMLVNAEFDPVNKVVIFNGPGRRVGVYRMWGVLRTAANAGTTSGSGQSSGDNLTGSTIASVSMSIDLESYNGTIQLQGTIGKVFGAIESAGHPLTDVLAVTGGTGTFRSASGDADLTPMTDAGGIACTSVRGFQVALREAPKPPRFGNIFPF